MRRALFLTLIILIGLPIANATQISADTEDSASGTLSGDYIVESGATWTVSGDYDIEEGTTVTVEDGATMVISGSMNAVAEPMLNLAGTANVLSTSTILENKVFLELNSQRKFSTGLI